MPQPRKLVYGVGINDNPPYTTKCHYYCVWLEMLRRCYSERFQQRNPTYIGCTVDERWHLFSTFKEWAMSQGDIKGKSLDKDILKPGNKVYSPETCIFVPQKINLFLTTNKSKTNGYPVGVRKKKNKYAAEIKFNSKYQYIGAYNTPEEAYKNYVKRKKEIALIYKEESDDPIVQDALQRIHDHVEDYLK